MPHRFPCFALLVAALAVQPAAAQAKHTRQVRVILDVSLSMKKNDPNRLAALATLLLHDLVRPQLPADSFKVIPFHPDIDWKDAGDPIPTQTGSIIERTTLRQSFADELQKQPYVAQMTYFYPGLLAAINDLSAYKGKDDVRVIVIVSDGLPEEKTRQAELEKIRSELVGRMASAHIRLYILAFGREASGHPEFFNQLIPSSGGELWMDRTGESLLVNMAQLFSRSFGYTVDIPPRRVYPDVKGLDLAGGNKGPTEVAALIFWNQLQAPSLSLRHSAGLPANAVQRWQASEQGAEGAASYALHWVVNPEAGDYQLQSDAHGAGLAILRPAAISIQIVPPFKPPDGQTYQTIAGAKFPLGVLLTPSSGAGRDPGEFEVTFQPLGERVLDQEEPEKQFSYYGREGGSLPGDRGTVVPNRGRAYPVFPQFNQPAADQEYYVGHLRVEARKNGVLAASTVHPVLVYPHLEISPLPREQDARPSHGDSGEIKKGEKGCAEFKFQLLGEDPRMPHPDRPSYLLQAALGSALPPGLQDAEITLDGGILQVEGTVPKPGKWLRGVALSDQDLLGPHQVCVRVGNPAGYQPNQVLDLPLAFKLDETPYRQFPVIQGFTLHVKLAPPGIERLLFKYLPLLLLLMIPLAFWYMRPRPTIPDDLAFRLGSGQPQAEQQKLSLGPPPVYRRLLGLRPMHPVWAEGQGEPLGWVRPENEPLYSFRPAKNVQISAPQGIPAPAANRRRALLKVGTDYLLRREGRVFAFRLEYR